MDYQGPQAADLANVYSLNLSFLGELGRADGARSGLAPGSEVLIEKLAALVPTRAERLAQCPFLIFSLTETDDTRWARLFEEREPLDLLDRLARPADASVKLVAATLGFLWELARRNPYAARLSTGASLDWCEQLADCPPLQLIQFATTEQNLLSPRLRSNSPFWQKMLGAATSKELDVRQSAQVCALQTVLTHPSAARYKRLPAAACSMPRPAMRVADRAKPDAGRE